ncbi:MAG: 2-C-methyl-D-erythritol 4-phosphate cytidylyltransferase [Proteobacteria bacterium]|nr:2-C-methyl-D-erythritol 4-phosphate cytidylyltransferase [Pseudomonadota bacterium]
MGFIDAILLGAGHGTRYSQSEEQPNQIPKQFHLLEGKPVFIWALKSIVEQAPIRRVVIVIAPNHLELAERQLRGHFSKPDSLQLEFVSGGNRRQDSSVNAIQLIKSLTPHPKLVMIHDACRPFLGNTLKNALASYAQQRDFSGWIPGLSVTETIKRVKEGKVLETIDRSELIRVQTPQLFKFDVLMKILEQIQLNSEMNFTDDASMLERFEEKIAVFPGDERNVKMTYEIDSQVLGHFLKTKGRIEPCESEPVTTFTA